MIKNDKEFTSTAEVATKVAPAEDRDRVVAEKSTSWGPRFALANYELQRDPDESDEDYAFRRSLFGDDKS